MEKSKLSIKENIAWNTVGNFTYLLSQWIVSYLVVTLLGFEGAGILSLATTITGSFIGISLYGMRSFQVSDIEEKYSARTYQISRIITSAVALLVCFLFIIPQGYSQYISICILVYMCFKLIESGSDVFQGIMQKALHMEYIGISFILRGLVTLALFALVIFLTDNLLFGILAMLISSASIVFVYDAQKAKRFAKSSIPREQQGSTKALLKECLPVAVFFLVFNTVSLVPRYFIEIQMGVEALGVFTTVAMPAMIVQVSAAFVFNPLVTPFAQLLNNNDIRGFLALLKKAGIFTAGLSAASLLLFWLLGDWLLLLLFGAKIEPYTYLLLPLVVSTILVAISWLLATILIVLRKLKMLMSVTVILFVVVVLSSYPFIATFGLNGANFVLILALALFIIVCIGIVIHAIKSRQQRSV